MKKKQILKIILIGCLLGTSIHPIIKANEQVNSPTISGIPTKWTNDPIRLTILRNTNDFMYSFSEIQGTYKWQKSNQSRLYGNNTIVYASVMNKNGEISEETKVMIDKLDMLQSEVNVDYTISDHKIEFVVDAQDELSSIDEYSFDNGKTWQTSNKYQVDDVESIQVCVKDNAGNISIAEQSFTVDMTKEEPLLYSFKDVINDEGNRMVEMKVEHSSSNYEYNIQTSNEWSQQETIQIPYEEDGNYIVKQRLVANGKTRAINEIDEMEIPLTNYPILNGPAILQEKGKIRLVAQGKTTEEEIVVETHDGKYVFDGYEYQVEYSFDLINWRAYTEPENILPSDYGKTLYARLSGPNKSYISKKTLVNDDILELVSYYEPKQQISESLLTYEEVDDLLNARFELGYMSTQFRDENNREESTIRCKNVICFSLQKNANRTALKEQYMVATEMKTEDNYYFEDLAGNRIDFDYTIFVAWYADEKKDVAYHMSGSNRSDSEYVGVLDSISDKNGNTLNVRYRDTYSAIIDFNDREYRMNDEGMKFPTDTIIDGDIYKKEGFQDYDLGRNCEVTYDDNGRITKLEYDDGSVIDYQYEIEDNRIYIVKEIRDGEINTYKYDLNFDLIQEEENGLLIDYQNNHKGDVVTEETSEKMNIYDYDDNGNMTSGSVKHSTETEAELIVTNTYDDKNNLVSTKTKDCPEERYEYDENQNMVKSSLVVQEANSTSEEICENTIYEYDDKGNLVSELDEVNALKTVNTYDEMNNLVSSENIDLNENISMNTETNIYDEAGRVLSKTDSDYTNTYVYDQLGNTLLKCESNVYTRYVYDSKARLIQEISGDDYVSDEDGLMQSPISDTYSNSNKGKRIVYNELGQITNTTSPLGYETENVYEGDQLSKTYTDIYQTVYTYNGMIERYRINGYTKLLNTYDADKRLKKTAYANSQNMQYLYSVPEGDEEPQLLGTKFNQDNELRFEYQYNQFGKKTETLDVKSGLKKVMTDNGFVIYNISDDSIYHSYLTNQNITNETALGNTYVSDEEENKRIWSKDDIELTSSENKYSLDGKLESVTNKLYENNDVLTLVETPTYDKEMITNLAVSGVDGRIYNFKYTYDTKGNIKRAWGSLYNSHYTYDDKNQLTKVIDSTNGITTLYTYDNRGNMVSEIKYNKDEYESNAETATPLETIAYTYGNDLWEDQLTKVNNKTITYDDMGNRTSYDGWNYTWEGGRQLASMSKGNTTITYKYDDSGIRTEKKVNDKTIRYTTVEGRITSQDDGINKLYFYYDEYDSLLGFEHNGTPYLYIRNIQGDIYGITDVNGNLVVRYEYDAWGKVKEIIGNQTLGQLNPMRYRGYYYDEETGLYYLQSRYYDASVRRFINADDMKYIGNSGSYISYNLYAYCENSPVYMVDNYGKSPIQIISAIGFGVLGAGLGCLLASIWNFSGWKKLALVTALAVGGAVAGAFLGPYIYKVATKYLYSKITSFLVSKASTLNRTKTVLNHISKRPYINSTMTIQNIMKGGTPVADKSLKYGLKWVVSGSYNNKSGIWELVIDYKTNTIVHFLFRGK